MAAGVRMLMSSGHDISQSSIPHVEDGIHVAVYRDFSNSRSDVCEMNAADIRIHGNSSTIFVASLKQLKDKNSACAKNIRPYARKADLRAMRNVTSFKIEQVEPNKIPHCTRHFNLPAVVFSTEGYAGNHFHDFTDVLVPLYLTSRQFDGEVVFLITNKHGWWTYKYKIVLDRLSSYEIIDIDKENQVMCFPRMIVGLRANREFGIDPYEYPYYSTPDFTRFLRRTYSLERESVRKKYCPRMLIISRKRTRHLRNEGEIATLARGLGFDVLVREMGSNVSEVARLVNSFDVVMGVHGAGLTNMVFLPENAVVVQIIPFGLDSLGRDYFEKPAKDMNLKYIEYRVSVRESSLWGRYEADSEVYRNPNAIHEKGFSGFRSIYLYNQDITLDLIRFNKTLLKARELVAS